MYVHARRKDTPFCEKAPETSKMEWPAGMPKLHAIASKLAAIALQSNWIFRHDGFGRKFSFQFVRFMRQDFSLTYAEVLRVSV